MTPMRSLRCRASYHLSKLLSLIAEIIRTTRVATSAIDKPLRLYEVTCFNMRFRALIMFI